MTGAGTGSRRSPVGRVLHGGLHLLDRQIVDDASGRMLAKVDDVQLEEHDGRLVVAALLTGPAAWGPRLPGLLGRWVCAVHRRLHPDPDPAPEPVGMRHVVEIGSAVRVDRPDLGARGFGRWVDEQAISRIPGSGHAPQ